MMIKDLTKTQIFNNEIIKYIGNPKDFIIKLFFILIK